MKSIFFLFAFSVVCQLKVYGQNMITGIYRTYFGNSLNIKADSTFEYRWSFDMQSSWTHGKWFVKEDTILFQMIPVYDTLKIEGENRKVTDSLILSLDPKPEQVTPDIFKVLYSYGQNTHSYPEKLVFKKGKLFRLAEDGSVIRKKQRGLWIRKKFIPWYFRYKQEE